MFGKRRINLKQLYIYI